MDVAGIILMIILFVIAIACFADSDIGEGIAALIGIAIVMVSLSTWWWAKTPAVAVDYSRHRVELSRTDNGVQRVINYKIQCDVTVEQDYPALAFLGEESIDLRFDAPCDNLTADMHAQIDNATAKLKR